LAVALVFLGVVFLSEAAFARARRMVPRGTPRQAVIARCLSRAGVTPPFKMVASLTVSRRGRVTRASLTEGALPDESRACVIGELRRIRFPRRHARLISMPLVYVGS
jgi:hypothetical protein